MESFFIGALIGIIIFLVILVLEKPKPNKLDEESSKQIVEEAISNALKGNNEAFLTLANDKFNTKQEEFNRTFQANKKEIVSVLNPLNDSLKNIESQRKEDHGGIQERIKALLESEKNLKTATEQLTGSLKNPNVSGNLGEIHLKKVLEHTGLINRCDFFQQASTHTEDGKLLKPDILVNLPQNRSIIIDAKNPLKYYLDNNNKLTEEEKLGKLKEAIKEHIKNLSQKNYHQELDLPNSPEFTVLYLPYETLLSDVLRVEPSLLEDAMQKSIIIATPTTLIALLKTVALSWKEAGVAQNYKELLKIGTEFKNRLKIFEEHFETTINRLNSTSNAFEKMKTSFENRLKPQADKFESLSKGEAQKSIESS